ncbi:hypothetical protein MMC21_006508 [Puttea exsequens]|nr:hypothetical protein [Puttea exsequens]
MGDPLSVIASVASLAELALRTINLMNGVKDGRDQRGEIATQVRDLFVGLGSIKGRVEAAMVTHQNASWTEEFRILREEQWHIRTTQLITKKITSNLEPKNGARKVLYTLRRPIPGKSEVDSILGSVIELKKPMDNILEQSNNALEQETYSLTRETKTDTGVMRKAMDVQNINAILEWLSSANFFENNAALLRQKRDGTGRWFLESPIFCAWKPAQRSTMWCPEIPGAGKTYLTSIVAQHLQEIATVPSCLVLVAYCRYNDLESQSLNELVSRLLKEAYRIKGNIDQESSKFYQS